MMFLGSGSIFAVLFIALLSVISPIMPDSSLENALPADTVMYAQVGAVDFQAGLKSVKDNLQSLQMLLGPAGASQEEFDKQIDELFKEAADTFKTDPSDIKKMAFGATQIHFAITRITNDEPVFIMAIKVPDAAATIAMLKTAETKFALKKTGDRAGSAIYGISETSNSMILTNDTAIAVSTGGLFVFSNDKATMEAFLDGLTGTNPNPLKNNPLFTKTKTEWNEKDCIRVYTNIQAIKDSMLKASSNAAEDESAWKAFGGDKMGAFFFSIQNNDKAVSSKSCLFLTGENGFAKAFLNAQPAELKLASYVPENAIIFIAAPTSDASKRWQDIKTWLSEFEIVANEDIIGEITEVEKDLGFPIADIVSVLGDEAAFFMAADEGANMFGGGGDSMQYGFVAKVKDQAKAKTVLLGLEKALGKSMSDNEKFSAEDTTTDGISMRRITVETEWSSISMYYYFPDETTFVFLSGLPEYEGSEQPETKKVNEKYSAAIKAGKTLANMPKYAEHRKNSPAKMSKLVMMNLSGVLGPLLGGGMPNELASSLDSFTYTIETADKVKIESNSPLGGLIPFILYLLPFGF